MKNKEPHKMIELLKIKFERVDGKEYKITVDVNEGYTETAKNVAKIILYAFDASSLFRKLERHLEEK